MTKAKLTPKQARFVQEYLIDLDATKAATRAGYSARTAKQQGHVLLQKPHVQAAVKAATDARSERTGITADRVLQELARLGFSDLRRAFDEKGNLKRPEEWDDDTAAAIASVEVVTRSIGDGEVEQVHKIKVWDKNSALEKLGKHLKMFVERHEHTGKDGTPVNFIMNLHPEK